MTAATDNSNRFTGRLTLLAAACLLTGSLGVAQAASPTNDVPTVVVSYTDLDLSTTEGVQTLYKRISIAAREVCPFEDTRDLARMAIAYKCRQASVSRAVRDIHSPQLAALHAEHVNHG
jgi:UrcA family protein